MTINKDNRLVRIIMNRDNMDEREATNLVKEAQCRVYDGEDPETVLYEELGLEPDYVFDLIEI